MMWAENDVVMVSALEHFSYCPRQCGLIHLESIFDENVFTLRGQRAHERVDEPCTTTENGIRIERALPIWSDTHGLVGRADAVEFHADGRVVPVEHKQGPRRVREHDDVQLCAQALCLEEMLGGEIPSGAVYSVKTRRRREVAFTSELRVQTLAVVAAVREMKRCPTPLPPALNDSRCPRCSLLDACVPATVIAARHTRLARALYLAEQFDDG